MDDDTTIPRSAWWVLGALLLALVYLAFGPGTDFFGLDRTVVGLSEYTIVPGTLEMEPGETRPLVIENVGSEPHTFVVLAAGFEVTRSEDVTDDMVLFAVRLFPGETTRVEFTAPAIEGDHQIVCRIRGHVERGMEATLRVREG